VASDTTHSGLDVHIVNWDAETKSSIWRGFSPVASKGIQFLDRHIVSKTTEYGVGRRDALRRYWAADDGGSNYKNSGREKDQTHHANGLHVAID